MGPLLWMDRYVTRAPRVGSQRFGALSVRGKNAQPGQQGAAEEDPWRAMCFSMRDVLRYQQGPPGTLSVVECNPYILYGGLLYSVHTLHTVLRTRASFLRARGGFNGGAPCISVPVAEWTSCHRRVSIPAQYAYVCISVCIPYMHARNARYIHSGALLFPSLSA